MLQGQINRPFRLGSTRCPGLREQMRAPIENNLGNELPYHGVRIGFTEALARFEAALTQIRQWQLRLGQGNRWIKYRDSLRMFVEDKGSTAPKSELERLAFELREIDEFCEIVEALGRSPSSAEAAAIQTILSGTMHPDLDRGSGPRDIQYELWLLAYLRAHGIHAWLGEPDLWFRWNKSDYPVAAKRPRSRVGLDRSIQAAIRQLRPHRPWGLIAISLDVIARPRGMMLAPESPEEAAVLTDLVFVDLLKWLISPHSPLSRRAPGTNALSFIATLQMPAFGSRAGEASLDTRLEFLSVKGDVRPTELTGLREIIGSFA